MQIQQIHVSNITIDRLNPRRTMDSKAVEALASNLRTHGVLSPLIVRPTLPEGVEPLDLGKIRYSVLCGSRRLAASRQAELSSVPCIIRQLSDQEAAEVALLEQGSHESLTLLELAEGLAAWKEAGATPEEIGQKMDRKRAWVFSTLQLNTLTPEAKRAVNDGRIEDSTARDLATVPASAQGACLKKLLQPGASGPMTVREAKEIVGSFRRDLTKAPFDPEDGALDCIEHKGTCTTCPFRSGSNPDLFEDARNENLCTSPGGYASRAEHDWQRRVVWGETGTAPKCFDPKQSDRYFDERGALKEDAPYVSTEAIAYEDVNQRKYDQLVPRAAPRYLARNPKTGDVVELLERAKLPEFFEEAGRIKRPVAASRRPDSDDEPEEKLTAEEKRELKKKAERVKAVMKLAIGEIASKVAKREPAKGFWKDLATSLSASLEHLWERRDVQEGPEEYLRRLDGPELRGFVWEAVHEFELYRDGRGRYPDFLAEQAKEYGVDLKEHERTVMAAERVQPEVKKVEEEKVKSKKGRAA